VDAVASALSPATPLDALQTAIEQLQGEFLEGFSLPDAPDFETWATGQREWQHRRGETLFDAAVRRQIELGRLAEAVDTATRWTRYAPLTETAYRRLIEAHALSGDRTAALQAYDTCRRLLADELGVSPATETTALAERVKQDKIRRAPRQKATPRPTSGDATPTGSDTSPPLVIPLVGRAAEYSRLVSIYRQAAQGQFQTAALIGEAGMGKTRLAEMFLDWATLEVTPADALHGRAFEIGGNLPYQPVVEALRLRLDRENAPDDLLDDVWLAELSQLLPELRSRYPDLPPPMAGNAEFVQARLFEAVAQLGAALAERQPLILFIDDVQWADAGTWELLHYLARRWSALKTPALLLLTIRQEGLLTIPALREWLLGLGRDTRLTRLELAPLSPADLSQLARTLAPDDAASARFGTWLAAETGGAPFFVAELLQLLQQQAMLVSETQADGRRAINMAATLARLQSARRVPLPPTVRDLVLTRLGRLSAKANELLLAGAVIGRQCSFERLCQVARIDEFDGLTALEELLYSRLMLETETEARPFTFAHDNIRDVIYTEAGATRRRLYHRQAFTALEQDRAAPAELAFHAGLAGLPQPAFTYAIAAGDNALALHAYADAVGFYEQALKLTDRATFTSAQLCHLCTSYGRSLELAGRYQDALDHYIEATANARQNGHRELELATLVAQGTIRSTANEFSDFALGESLGQAALVLARALDDKAAEAKIQWNLLNVYRMTGRNEQALTAGEQSLALAQELDLREPMAYAANDLVYVYQAKSDVRRTVTLAETTATLWRELGNQPMLTDSLVILANIQAMCGFYDVALNGAAEALAISQSLKNKWAISYSLFTYCLVHWRTMAVEPALMAMNESVQLAQEVRFTGAQAVVRIFQAQLRLALGDVVQVRDLAETATSIAANAIPLFLPNAQATLALVALQAGQPAEADHIIASNAFRTLPFSLMNFLTPETVVCNYALHTGNYEEAYTFSGKTLAFLIEQNLRMYSPDFYYIQGQALLGLNRPAEAREALQTALAILRETGGRWQFWEIAALLADVEAQAGNDDIAADLRQEARTVLDTIIDALPEGELRASFVGLPGVQKIVQTP
ncbi:MAG: AAA family ATPase, partial [Anaerolineae bacterium]|nr:AAA family ATPase [Anaerolineae bacterium]